MRVVAFLGRYAHQPADVIMRMPVDEVRLLAEATGQLLQDENELQRAAENG